MIDTGMVDGKRDSNQKERLKTITKTRDFDQVDNRLSNDQYFNLYIRIVDILYDAISDKHENEAWFD